MAQLALDQIERRVVDASARQLIHNDIRSVNLLVVEERISAILDFEEIATGRRVDDLAKAAVMLNTRFREWQPAPWTVQQSFLEGYRSRHPLSSAEELLLVPLMLWNSTGQASSALGRRGETAWLEAVDRLADQLG